MRKKVLHKFVGALRPSKWLAAVSRGRPSGRSPVLPSYLLLLALIAPLAAADDTLRCGSKIVRLGMTEEEVRGYCGAPSSSRVEEQDVRVGGRLTGKTEQHIWRYDRAAGQRPAELVFDDDKLRSITYLSM